MANPLNEIFFFQRTSNTFFHKLENLFFIFFHVIFDSTKSLPSKLKVKSKKLKLSFLLFTYLSLLVPFTFYLLLFTFNFLDLTYLSFSIQMKNLFQRGGNRGII